MRKSVEISKEANAVIESGKKVVGQLYKDKVTGRIVFKKFNRNKRKKDIVIKELESGSLKESSTRIKFYSSVKKTIGVRCIREVMDRDFETGMEALEKHFV